MYTGIHEINKRLQPVFDKYRDAILFAYLFGSAIEDSIYPPHDIDIAVFFTPESGSELYNTRFLLHGDICRSLKTNNVDVIVLNTLSNLIMCDEIVRKGVLIFERDKARREEYELKVLHDAIDFKRQRFVNMGI